MARKPKANPEHDKLIEVLKFTPRTYKIQLWGYGGELVLGEIDKKVWDYFREHRIDVSDYATDSEFGEGLNIPEDCQPFWPGQWHDCDNLFHSWGVSKNAGTMQIFDEQDQLVYERELDSIDGTDVNLNCNEEAWIEMKGKGSCVFYNYSSEKGTFFEGTIELKTPFDPEKLTICYADVDSEELVTSIEYDGETLENYGGDTTGKGYDFSFYHVDEEGELQQYRDGSDVDENYNDGTPPSGPSPSDWESSPKFKGVNPVYTGWYSANYDHGTTYGSLYWNGTYNVWEDYYHGRVTRTYETVNWWQGYNWDTSSWVNRPPEPPNIICKKCKHTGDSDKMERDDDFNVVCPECGSTKTDWIDYDPESKKGLANRKKYCKEWDPALALDRIVAPNLDAELDKIAAQHPGAFPTAAMIDELEQVECVQCDWKGSVDKTNDWDGQMACPECGEPVEFIDDESDLNPWKNSTTTEAKELTWWTVKTVDKKSVTEIEEFTKDGSTLTHTTMFRWGSWKVATNDNNPPEFEFNESGRLDMNSCYENNIEEVELISMDDGCYEDLEWSEDVSGDEQEKAQEIIDEDGLWELESHGWNHYDTYVYVSGPLEISNKDGEVVKVVNE